jgi:MFS family permease
MRTASASATDQAFSQKAMLWIVFAGFFMQTLDTTIVNTALPAMARSLGENHSISSLWWWPTR